MSTANQVPETWGLTGDDAKETLERTGRWTSSGTRSNGSATPTASATRGRWRISRPLSSSKA